MTGAETRIPRMNRQQQAPSTVQAGAAPEQSAPLAILPLASWAPPLRDEHAQDALEHGQVLWFPRLAFSLHDSERRFLTPDCADGQAKNISFDPATKALQGTALAGSDRAELAAMLARYASQARGLVEILCPGYAAHLQQGRTSYRPVEIEGRQGSYKKDDTRLHVDAFASRPNHGWRILRIFSNINPHGGARVWHVGEPFEDFAEKFYRRAPPQFPGSAWLLERLGVTKGRRSRYDHVMLALHDRAKADQHYQQSAARTRIEFPPGSTWMVFTDRVLHAALSGQYVLEQTLHLPPAAMRLPGLAPLRILERLMQRHMA